MLLTMKSGFQALVPLELLELLEVHQGAVAQNGNPPVSAFPKALQLEQLD